MRCPRGHIGPFEPILIGLPNGSEWWLQCRAIDEGCSDCSCWCDERFLPDPVTQEFPIFLMVSPEMYTELVRMFPYGIVLKRGNLPISCAIKVSGRVADK